MRHPGRHPRLLRGALLGSVLGLLAPAGALAASLHPTLLAKASYGGLPVGFARSADGILHVAYETNTSWGDSASGVGAEAITPSGQVLPAVQALSWSNGAAGGSPNGVPGLAVLPGGTLQAVFGGSPSGDDGPWGISSTDGGHTWSAPADVGSGLMEFGDSNMTLQNSGGTPVFTAGCCGNVVIQQGFGPGSPTYQLTNTTDGSAGNTASAVDAATGAVVASWDSVAGSGGIWMQQATPAPGVAVKVPIPSQYSLGIPLIIAGRDTGPGVFATYPADYGSTTHMRLLRYGGGSVAVGSVKGMHATTWGTATGPDGRIWVMWSGTLANGQGVTAVTRSNQAVTKFEPIQVFHFTWTFDFYSSGDGRLGPLDMLISGTPQVKTGPLTSGIYYARFLPKLSAHVSVKKAGSGKFKLSIKITDAGDPVSGASASAKGHHKKSSASGVDKLTLKGSSKSRVTVKISDPGYQSLKIKVKL